MKELGSSANAAATTPADGPDRSDLRLGSLLGLFFGSGAAALIYEVLWLKELGRLFGVTAYAASTTLAVFFLGLALGGLVWGRRAERLRNPLRAYAWLEVGVGASALMYFLLFDFYRAVQAPLFGSFGYQPVLLLLVKFVLATGVLLLPAFLMGGTLPVMAQVLVRKRSQLGTRTTLLYAVNTIGAATGALAAGFLLPRLFGFAGSYLVAIALNLVVAAIAWSWSRGLSRPAVWVAAPQEKPMDATGASAAGGLSATLILAVAGVSGLTTLGLEVIWTRMFSQVLQNSVYTFSIILTVFLAGLSIGSALAHVLCLRVRSTRLALALLLAGSGVLVSLSPFMFRAFSEGLDYMKSGLGFWPYVGAVFAGTALAIGPAVVMMGAVFPFLLRLSETHSRSAGRTVGHLAAVNTTAAILGSLLAGFVLLRLFGVWGSVRGIALIYLLLALGVWPWAVPKRRLLAVLPAAAFVVVGLVDYGDYSRLWIEEEAGEKLVEAWDGPAGAVAVVQHDGESLRIRVNSSYNLGSSASAVNERLQGQIPLLLHPNPRSVFFLGLGTGITASGAMSFDVDRVVVCEVNPDVIRASRAHFSPWLNGLFEDSRFTVLPEDGRTWLAATRQRFDVVIADLFLSFKAGVGSLYTLEHFEAVRDHLEPGGIFVQWLPMFDLSEPEFDIVTKTMLEVFPSVTLWRRSHSPSFPVYALVGSLDDQALDPDVFQRRVDELRASGNLDPRIWLLNIPYAAYVSNLRALEARFREAPLNTDDRTILEYIAPITERNARGAKETQVLAWSPLLDFCQGLMEELPPERDPYLALVGTSRRAQVRASLAYYGYALHSQLNNDAAARSYLQVYQLLLQGRSP